MNRIDEIDEIDEPRLRLPVPWNEDPLRGFNEIAKRARCVVTLCYPDGTTRTWETEGLVEIQTALTRAGGNNVRLSFYDPVRRKDTL